MAVLALAPLVLAAVAAVVAVRAGRAARRRRAGAAQAARLHAAFAAAPVAMALLAPDGRIEAANAELVRRTGFSEAELRTLHLDDLTPHGEREGAGGPWPRGDGAVVERGLLRRDGSVARVAWRCAPTHDGAGRWLGWVACCSLAASPPPLAAGLGELPDRARLVAHLAGAVGAGADLAVLVVDVDDLAGVNRALGREAGDEVLAVVAARLREAIRADDLLARLDGDAFAVVVPRLPHRAEAARLADRLCAALRPPVVLGDVARFVTASVGVRLHRGGAVPAESLLDDAAAAAARALARGGSRVEHFEPSLRAPALEQIELESALRRAFERGELRLHLQPVVALATGRVVAFEALARWEHPGLGLVPAAAFVDLAVRRGLGPELDAWALAEACRLLAAWSRPELAVCVNLTPPALGQRGLADAVGAALAAGGVAPERVWLDVPQAAVLARPAEAAGALRALRARGVRVALDDAGTQPEALEALGGDLPVDAVKLDCGVVGALAGAEGRARAARTVRLAQALGATVVAERVEGADEVAVLRELGVALAQGRHFAPPQAPGAAARLLAGDRLGELAA
jgi:diguanylate cyclase (GGDEF)-like protein/PAS domain S-box-containing protein